MKRQMNGNIFPIVFLAFSVLLVGTIASTTPATNLGAGAGILTYHSNVCVEVDRADGTHTLVECENNPNFFMPAGKELVKHELGTGASLGAVNTIVLCNISPGSLAINASSCYGNNTGANGLGNTTGSFFEYPGVVGNWSNFATFTSTTDGQTVNGTLLMNGSTQPSGVIFANNTFNAVTLNTNDQITIRWNISIS